MKDILIYLLKYLRGNKVIVYSFVFVGIVLNIMFFLFELDVNLSIYFTLIVSFICVLIGSVNFIRKYNQYNNLLNIKYKFKNNSVSMRDSKDPNEQILIEIINQLQNSRATIEYQKDNAISDMNLYYSIWAHQIKTPIAAMNLQMQTENLPQYKELSNQLFKIEEYVDMALNYIRAESMSGDMVIEKYNLDNIVKNVLKKYSRSFIRKKLSLEYEGLNVNVLTDGKWLEFVLEQLISNAIKYTKEGKISIYMESDNILVIEDTGIGIKDSDIPRLFEKGYTGYNGREYNKSTGIGLYLCKKILNKLSHSISVESEISVGTKTKIEFIS